jgi:WD40 repeat protein
VICCEFSPDGQFLASAGYDKYIKVWNAQTGDEVISLRGHRGMVNGLAWNYSGTLLATASQDKTVKIWNPWVSPDEACVHTISEHTRVVRTVAFSYDGLKLATGCEDGTLRLFDANDFSFLCGQNGHAPRGLNHLSFCSTPGKEHMLVTAGDDRAVKVWDTNDLSLIHTFTGHHDGVTSAVFSADGERVLSASHDNLIICYQLKSGASIANLIGHTGSVFRAVFSTDGKYIVSCSFDRSVKVCQTCSLWWGRKKELTYIRRSGKFATK